MSQASAPDALDLIARGADELLKREELPNKGDYVDSGVGENEMFMEYAESLGTLNPLPYATVTYFKP